MRQENIELERLRFSTNFIYASEDINEDRYEPLRDKYGSRYDHFEELVRELLHNLEDPSYDVKEEDAIGWAKKWGLTDEDVENARIWAVLVRQEWHEIREVENEFRSKLGRTVNSLSRLAVPYAGHPFETPIRTNDTSRLVNANTLKIKLAPIANNLFIRVAGITISIQREILPWESRGQEWKVVVEEPLTEGLFSVYEIVLFQDDGPTVSSYVVNDRGNVKEGTPANKGINVMSRGGEILDLAQEEAPALQRDFLQKLAEK
jgi:hypothetical protein